jgi:hypothetical protein
VFLIHTLGGESALAASVGGACVGGSIEPGSATAAAWGASVARCGAFPAAGGTDGHGRTGGRLRCIV